LASGAFATADPEGGESEVEHASTSDPGIAVQRKSRVAIIRP
jgi:hypothetical protein